MNLEFKEDKKDLIFEKEHNLNTKPLQVDLLIIKKDVPVYIFNGIGTFFSWTYPRALIKKYGLSDEMAEKYF